MIPTSNTYNPYTTIRDVDMKIEFDLIDNATTSSATYSINEQDTISNLNQLASGETNNSKYATCENNLVMLDGSWDYLPDTITDETVGWWSNAMSDENGEFAINPKLTATLSNEYSCVGFTLYSDPTNTIEEFKVTTLNGDIEIDEEIFSGNGTNILIADLPANDFNKVEIEITKTKEPYRRVKILGFRFGVIKLWNKNNIISASVTEEVDVAGQTLPINELTVELDNSSGAFNIFSSTHKHVYVNAMKTAKIWSDGNVGSIAKLNELSNGITKLDYATCENNLVMLDGSWDYLDDNGKNLEVGYINNALSDDHGNLPTQDAGGILKGPRLRYSWDKHINISGIRLYFDKHASGESYPNIVTSGTITIQDDNAYVEIIEFTNYNLDEVIDIDVEVNGLNFIEFEFKETSMSKKFAKIPEIHFLKYVDSWGMYLTKNQKIKASFVINGETISMGSYLFDTLEQTNEGMTAKIKAKDYVAQLNEQKYTNGEHGTTTLDTALQDVLSGTGITIKYNIYEGGSGNTVSKSTPKNTTKRAALHYFCQAACRTCYINRQGQLRVLKLEATNAKFRNLDMDNIYSKDIIRLGEYVNMIRLTAKDEYTDPQTENTYYGGSGLYYREIENDCVAESRGAGVANWILEQKSRRVYFEIEYRGNPELELGDTIRITTLDGMIFFAVVYYQSFEYDGGLKCTMKAIV